MKKNYSFYIVLVSIPIFAFLFFGYSSGQTGQYSGSPGDAGNTCAVCHTGITNHNAVPTITTNIPPSGYVAGTTYQITVSVTSTSVRHGFQITAENASDVKVGTFIAGTDTQTANSNHLVTHNSSGTMQNAWTFEWTAPTNSEGDVTFYAAVNATNNDNNLTGDQIVTTTETVSFTSAGISENQLISFAVYPNPTTDYVVLKGKAAELQNATIQIFNNLGQVVLKSQLNDNLNEIDVTNLDKGIYTIQLKSGDKLGTHQFIKK